MRTHVLSWGLSCGALLGCGDAASDDGDTTGGGSASASTASDTAVPTTTSVTQGPSTTVDPSGPSTASADDGSDGSSDPSGASSGASSGDTGEAGRDYSNDRSKFFGDARCDVADVLLCDSFEDGALDEGVWQPSGDVSVDPAKGARGSGSLHVHAEQNAFAYVRETTTFPAPNNTYYGRMFVWIDALPVSPDWSHWTLVGAVGSGEPGEIRVGGQLNRFVGKNLFGIGSDGGPTGDWTNLDDDPAGAPLQVVVQDWVCVEWMHDGANDVTSFWWDADEHPSLGTTATSHGGNADAQYVMPEFESVWVGWWLYQGGPTPDHYDVWIDEVAIDGTRIGCIY